MIIVSSLTVVYSLFMCAYVIFKLDWCGHFLTFLKIWCFVNIFPYLSIFSSILQIYYNLSLLLGHFSFLEFSSLGPSSLPPIIHPSSHSSCYYNQCCNILVAKLFGQFHGYFEDSRVMVLKQLWFCHLCYTYFVSPLSAV